MPHEGRCNVSLVADRPLTADDRPLELLRAIQGLGQGPSAIKALSAMQRCSRPGIPDFRKMEGSNASAKAEKPFVLLVIGGTTKNNWYEAFAGQRVGERPVQVEMAFWDDIEVTAFDDSGAVVAAHASPHPIPGTSMERSRTFLPDFVLVRSAPFGIHNQDWTNAMLGLLSVPSLNSWDSLLKCQHKPVIYNHLLQLRKKMGMSAPGVYNFPLIPQTYYASYRGFAFCSGFPLVLKLGTVHAGYGKAKVESQEQWEDMKSLVALQGRYATTEPFIKWDYDLRVQKIGPHYRAFRRFSENWKGKGIGRQHDEDIPVTDQLRGWVDAAAAALGMDICAVC